MGLRRAPRLRAALEAKLPAFLADEIRPCDGAERVELLLMCYVKELHRASVRFGAESLAAVSAAVDDLGEQHGYVAACSAALAAAGRGEDAAGPGDDERTRLRKQALDWPRADLVLHATRAETDDRAAVVKTLREWQEEPDLAGLSDTAALVSLPAPDRDDFFRLWVDVAALLDTAETPSAGGPR